LRERPLRNEHESAIASAGGLPKRSCALPTRSPDTDLRTPRRSDWGGPNPNEGRVGVDRTQPRVGLGWTEPNEGGAGVDRTQTGVALAKSEPN
jgi:hypothetical protein